MTAYITNRPTVAAETFDDEAIVINMDSGVYYSLRGSAGQAWALLEAGATLDTLVSQFANAYAQDPADLRAALDVFLKDLETEGLVRPTDSAANPAPDLPAAGEPYEPPALVRYEDLQDLLLLDPIHEVDEEQGWPSPRPENPEHDDRPD